MNKSLVRKLIIRRLNLNPGLVDHSLYDQLFSLNAWRRAKTVATTLSTSIEIHTQPVIQRAWREHKRVVMPKVKPQRRMIFVPYRPDTHLVPNRFKILEPQDERIVKSTDIDLMVVPGLAFTSNGERLGFGGGYYDRYLKGYNGFTVALARTTQVFKQPIWPVNQYDVKINKVITDKDDTDE